MCGDQERTTRDSSCVTNVFHSSWLPSTCLYCLCKKHHNPLPMQQDYFGGQKLEQSEIIIKKTSSDFLLVLLDALWRQVLHTGRSCDRLTRQPQKGRSLSHDKWSTSLPRSLCQQPPSPTSPCLRNDLVKTEAYHGIPHTLWWKVWFKSAPTQHKSSLLGSFTYLFENIWFR